MNLVKVLFVLSVVWGMLYQQPPVYVDLDNTFLAPFQTLAHPLGTDRLGRDIYALYSYGIFSTVLTAIPARIITIVLSGFLSFLSYSLGSIVGHSIEMISSVFISLPSLLLALIVIGFLGDGIIILFLAIILSDWAVVFESIEGKLRELKSSGPVVASYCMGANKFHIYKKHILPSLSSILYILFITGIPSVIMTVAIFSFLGVDSNSSWIGPGLGEQISFSKDYFERSPFSLLIPTLGIFLLVNLSGKNLN